MLRSLTLISLSLVAALAAGPAAAQPLPAPPFAAPWLAFNTTAGSGTGDPVALAVADFTGDGRPDVVAAQGRSGTGFVLMANDGAGRLVRRTALSSPYSAQDIVAADFNGDGRADVALTNANDIETAGNTASVFLGRGDGTFETRREVSLGSGNVRPVGLVAADLDGDGRLDLAAAAYGRVGQGSTAVVVRGDGAGGFGPPAAVPAGPGPNGLAAGDMDGDGDADLVVANGAYRVSVLRNMGAGAFAAPVAYSDLSGNAAGPAFAAVALADVDGDGDLDVFYGNSRTGDGDTGFAVLLRNSGSGALGNPSNVLLPFRSTGPIALATPDLDGDGDPDLVTAQSSARTNDGLVVVLNDGTGAFGAPTLYKGGQSTSDVAAGDMDGDGDADLLSADDFSRAVTVRLNPGDGLFPEVPADPVDFVTVALDAADLDGDGDLDAFASGGGRSLIVGSLMRNDGGGRFADRTEYANGLDGVTSGVLRDLNGDGSPDLLFRSAPLDARPHDYFSALNDGSGTFPPATRWPVGSAALGEVEAVDLDHDGDLDVVSMETIGGDVSSGRFFTSKNNGDGTFQPPVLYDQLPGSPYAVVPGDFDEDGDVDLAMTQPGAFGFDAQVMVVLGNGDATFGPATAYTVGRGPLEIAAADFDGDGHLDLASGNTGYDNEGAESMTVLFGTGVGAFDRLRTYAAPFSIDLLAIRGLTTGDVDADGDPDLLLSGVSNDLTLYLNDGAGTFTVPYRLGFAAGAASPVFRDFTGDGRPDVLALTDLQPLGWDTALSVLPGLVAPVAAEPALPSGTTAGLVLSAPAPNPARGATAIGLTLAAPAAARVEVFDALGRRVAVLHDGALAAGAHALTLDASMLPAGVYVVRATSRDAVTSRRVVVAR